jgi:hypothetical protein
MRRMAIALAGAAALTVGGALMWGADAQIERGPAALAAPAENFTPVERAACGPHLGPVLRTVAYPSLRPLSLLVPALLNVKTRRLRRSNERRGSLKTGARPHTEKGRATLSRLRLPRHLERETSSQRLAVFADRLDHNRIGSGLEVPGQTGGPDVR